MTYVITDECIGCGVCEIFCKNGAVSQCDTCFTKFVIDESKCEACATCKEYCPIDGAIVERETVLQV